MQKSVQVQEGRLNMQNVVQVWWMFISQLVHIAYGHVYLQCIHNVDVHYLFAECNSP